MSQKRLSRPVLTFLAALAAAAGLAAAFWPRPVMVDLGTVERGAMAVTVTEEGRTRVRDTYVVSAPVSGRLLRVDVRPGDPVEGGETIVARMRPALPTALDVRTREQAMAAVAAARAALQLAEADLAAAEADLDLALSNLERTRRLAEHGTVSTAALDSSESAARAAEARRQTAAAAIELRRAEFQSTRAQLIGFDDPGLFEALEARLGNEFPVHAPIDGVILRVVTGDEGAVAAGTPILEIGDIETGLEVVVDLVSADAVRIAEGQEVVIENWGGPVPLSGEVLRVEPYGETRVSALGVEEQRVSVIVAMTSPPEDRAGLGHGFRVTARIVVWRTEDAVLVPASALFRSGGAWAVFTVEDGRARLRPVEIGRNNGVDAEVLGGLSPGEEVIVFPPPGLTAETRVAQRVVE